MSRNLNSILSKTDAARLRAAFGCPTHLYADLIEILAIELDEYETFGVLSLNTAFALTNTQLSSASIVEVKDYTNAFITITISTKLRTAVVKGSEILLETSPSMDTPRLTAYDDPYKQAFDELGDDAEAVPTYANQPDYVHWGEDVFLMSEARLRQELRDGDPLRLLHRTPYRPFHEVRRVVQNNPADK